MICTRCGTEIADKALICYRCGAPTSQPQPAASPSRRRGARGLLNATLLVLLAAVLWLGQVEQLGISPAVTYGAAVVLVLLLGWRLLRGRRG